MAKRVKSTKLTFDMIYADFRRRHPHLSKEVYHWRPSDYMEIQVFLSDGMILRYSYWDHKATICKANWRRDGISLG